MTAANIIQKRVNQDYQKVYASLIDYNDNLITYNNPLPINNDFGVPTGYSKQTANGDTWLLQKGQLNKLRLRPQIMNEHAESSRNIQGTVTSTNIVGQIFKASQDNINGINLTLESAAGADFDDFESYADDAAVIYSFSDISLSSSSVLGSMSSSIISVF